MAAALMRRSCLLASVRCLAALYVMQSASATEYRVGGSAGWTLGTDLQHWASQYTFNSGDDLFFPYLAGNHSVLLVTEDDYNNCNIANPIASDKGKGDMVTVLTKLDTYYFICGVEGHCLQGLRLSIHVGDPSTNASGPTSILLTPPNAPNSYTPPYIAPYSTIHHYNYAPATFTNTIVLSILCIAIAVACT